MLAYDVLEIFPLHPNLSVWAPLCTIQSQTWRRVFIPNLLAWAGSQDDPFGANAGVHSEVTGIWKHVFPSIPLKDADMDILVYVSENALNNWRSGIGKAGHNAVVKYFESDPRAFDHPENRAAFVSDSLEHMCFVYKNPEKASARGAFRSELILMVYSHHIRKTSTQLNKYSNQIGALALAAAAVERGLSLFASGEDALKGAQNRETSPFSNGHGLGFTENPWGMKAREFVTSTKKLKDLHWGEITDDISELKLLGRDWQNMDVDSDEDDNGDEGNAGTVRVNPRARINID
ncbi:hypothetical protein F5888DRAFT_1908221 [Russula emetica]|nr:hypothetical protein F5888DRAFT_1908221 [Russula emetica]